LSATLQGFQTTYISNVFLGNSESQRFNMTLRLGATAGTNMDIVVDARTLLAQSAASIGEALTADRIQNLPLVGNNVLQLLNTLPGSNNATFAGVAPANGNFVRDGLAVADPRFQNGVFATTIINPDLVGEVHLILTPVDAELGRGNAQIMAGPPGRPAVGPMARPNSIQGPLRFASSRSLCVPTGRRARAQTLPKRRSGIPASGPIQLPAQRQSHSI
jgi:hypothetical protein